MRLFIYFIFLFLPFLVFSQDLDANFTVSALKSCVGGKISFSNSSIGGGNSITKSAWDFGDGTTQTYNGNQNSEHSYQSPGNYKVTLTVFVSSDLFDSKVMTIQVSSKPVPDFSFTGNNCQVPANISFQNLTTLGTGFNYQWSFGNGVSSVSSNPSTIVYSSPGNYPISLNISSNLPGCSSNSITKNIKIYDFSATIDALSEICQEGKDPLVLIAKPSMKVVDSYSWNFMDGTVGENNDTVLKTFLKSGSFVIELTQNSSSIGCKSKTYHKVKVLPKAAPTFIVDKNKICPSFSVQFTNTTQTGNDFQWSFGDGTVYFGNTPPIHTYSNEGDMSVSLTSKGLNGCYGTTTKLNFVKVHNPIVSFKADSIHGCSMLPVNFMDETTSNDEQSNPIVDWKWDFGNGKEFSGRTPSKQFFEVGKYNVTLTVKSKLNCIVSKTINDFIKVGKIDALQFKTSIAAECARTDIQFFEQSTINAPHTSDELFYTWRFGDDQSVTAYNPKHSFKKDTGFFDVKMILDFRGCKDSITNKNSIYIKAPIAYFHPSQKLFCNPLSLPVTNQFIDSSIIGKKSDIVDVDWEFGDGQKKSLTTVNVLGSKGSTSSTFSDYATYKVFQTVTNRTTGCLDTSYQTFFVSKVVPDFTIENDSVCRYSSLEYSEKSSSTPLYHALVKHEFKLDDGGASVFGHTNGYICNSFGKYNSILKSTNNVGCSAIKTIGNITVLDIPKADIVSSKAIGCSPLFVNYTNSSKKQNNGVPMKSYQWYFDYMKEFDTTVFLSESKSITFLKEGNFYSTLQVTDEFNCKSKKDTVYVLLTKPKTEFRVDSVVCNNEEFIAINNTLGASYSIWILDDNITLGLNKDTVRYTFKENSTKIFVAHKITMKSKDVNECLDSKEHIVKVSLPIPGIKFKFSEIGDTTNNKISFKCPPIQCSYQDVSKSIGKIDSSYWNFELNSNAQIYNPIKNYVFPGEYSTTLRSIDEFGCFTDTTIVDFLSINGPKVKANRLSIGDICGQTYTFTLSNKVNVDQISWDFGDNTFAKNIDTVVHKYLNIQTYSPSVTVSRINPDTCNVTYPLEKIIIPNSLLNADFSVSSKESKLGKPIQFFNHSTPSSIISTHKWVLGDSDTLSSSQFLFSPTKKYNTGGKKNIELVITDKDGCTDQSFQQILILDDYDVPNVLTVNSDGLNDELTLFDSIFANFSISIFNRWGNKVYEQNNQTGVVLWNGYDTKASLCDEGVYFYRLEGELLDKKQLKKSGYITLIH